LVTTIDAAGDLLYGTGSDAATRLAIGTAGQVLAVNSGATAPEWATPVSGLTLISTTSLSGSETSITSIPTTYKGLLVIVNNLSTDGASGVISARVNSISGGSYQFSGTRWTNAAAVFGADTTQINLSNTVAVPAAAANQSYYINLPNYASASWKLFNFVAANDGASDINIVQAAGVIRTTDAITSVQIRVSSGNFDGGTALIYGVN
jgi:hypothetical protein